MIKKSKDTPSADAALRKRFKLSEKQSAEILNMRLARLTALEITKLEEELKDVRKFIKECKEILASKPRRMKILKEEMTELAHGFSDERRTEIVADQGEFSIEDLIAEEDMVITVSHAGYIKRLPVSAYRRQRRGGRGVISSYGNPRSPGINAINVEKGDELIDVQVTDGRNDVVLATHHGMSIRFHEKDVRDMGRTATGVNGIELDKKDQVIDMVIVRRASTLLTVTERGMGKRSELDEYRVQHRAGRGIITLKRNDKTGAIVALKEVQPEDELMMITKKGIMIRVPVDGMRGKG